MQVLYDHHTHVIQRHAAHFVVTDTCFSRFENEYITLAHRVTLRSNIKFVML